MLFVVSANAALPWEKKTPRIPAFSQQKSCEAALSRELLPIRPFSDKELDSDSPLLRQFKNFQAAKVAHARQELSDADLLKIKLSFLDEVINHLNQNHVQFTQDISRQIITIVPDANGSALNRFASEVASKGSTNNKQPVGVIFDAGAVGLVIEGASMSVIGGAFDSVNGVMMLSLEAIVHLVPTYVEKHEMFHVCRYISNLSGIHENFQFWIKSLGSMLSTRVRAENIYHDFYLGEEIIVALDSFAWFNDIDLSNLSSADLELVHGELLTDLKRLEVIALSLGRELNVLSNAHSDCVGPIGDRFVYLSISLNDPSEVKLLRPLSEKQKPFESGISASVKSMRNMFATTLFSRATIYSYTLRNHYMVLDLDKELAMIFPESKLANFNQLMKSNIDAWGKVNAVLGETLKTLKGPGNLQTKLISVQTLLKTHSVESILPLTLAN